MTDTLDERVGTPATASVGRIIHLLGRAGDETIVHVVAVTRALAAGGVPQTVILLDDPHGRALLARFDPTVHVVLAAATSQAWRRPAALLRALTSEAASRPPRAVHLHGMVPGLVGIFAAKMHDLPAPLHLTLYGSGPWRHPSRWLAMALRRLAPSASGADAAPGTVGPVGQIDVVEGSVAEAFFHGARREARRPLIVAASRQNDARAAARFTQLAVLLHDASLRLGFNWVGPADATALAQLGAAGIGQFEVHDDAHRIARLRTAWIYVAGGDTSSFPNCLAEAMALGLACVAWATPMHRALIRDGETGLLCDSEDELLTRIAHLIDSPAERRRLGAAARLDALRRFHPVGLGSALLASYSAATAESQRAATRLLEEREGHDSLPSGTPSNSLLPMDR